LIYLAGLKYFGTVQDFNNLIPLSDPHYLNFCKILFNQNKTNMQKKLSAIILIAFLISISVFYSCNNNSKEPTTGINNEDSLQAKLERGKYLVYSVVNCVDCHSQLDTSKFSAPIVPGTEGAGGLAFHELLPEETPGKIYAPNITPHALKDWTDDEIARAMTRGVNKKGDTLFPVMPYHGLSRMAKEDVEAVITYLRTLKPIENNIPASQLFVPAAAFGLLPDLDYEKNMKPDTAKKCKKLSKDFVRWNLV